MSVEWGPVVHSVLTSIVYDKRNNFIANLSLRGACTCTCSYTVKGSNPMAEHWYFQPSKGFFMLFFLIWQLTKISALWQKVKTIVSRGELKGACLYDTVSTIDICIKKQLRSHKGIYFAVYLFVYVTLQALAQTRTVALESSLQAEILWASITCQSWLETAVSISRLSSVCQSVFRPYINCSAFSNLYCSDPLCYTTLETWFITVHAVFFWLL